MRTNMGACVLMTAVLVATGLGQGECTREYKGDLVLTGDQRLVINEGTLCVHGNIILRDRAILDISNATVRFSGLKVSVWEDYARIEIGDGAQCRMMNMRFEVMEPRVSAIQIVAWGTARVSISGMSTPTWVRLNASARGEAAIKVGETTLWVAYVGERGSLEIADSSIEWASLGFSSSSRGEVADLRQGYYTSWELPRGLAMGISMKLRNSHIRGGWSVHLSESSKVTILRSTNIGIGVDLASIPERIYGMRAGFHDTWSLWNGGSASAVGNITLVSTSVAWWDLYFRNLRHAVEVVHSGPTSLFIWDSSTTLRLDRTEVKALTVANSYLNLVCSGATINVHGFDGVELSGSRLDIRGGLGFPSATKVVWSNSTSLREYEVHLRDRSGQPVRGVQLQLEDPSGAVTAHTPDQDGVLRFTIWFDDRNYDKTWTLIVPGSAGPTRVSVTLLTSTPIQVRVP